ncbi:MAG: MarR family transcriptional regulator [Clostridia bacterium]|nr:MarR family transcriptional regulator [Clostridia bacterium]
MEKNYDALKLENQLCFPLYAASREITKRYRPYLDALDITYTQYICLMVLWEHRTITVRDLGKLLFLDSGTLTPVLKNMEKKGLVTRSNNKEDERLLDISITGEGMALREKAADIPMQMSSCIHLKPEDAASLYRILYAILGEGETK